MFRQLSQNEVIEHKGDAMMILPREVLQVALDEGWALPPGDGKIH